MQDRSQKPPADPGVRRQRRPAFTVRAAIERDQQILFMRARDESSSRPDGCWYFLPGGHVNHRETLEQALRREIREEIGIELDHLRPAFLREFIAPDRRRVPLHDSSRGSTEPAWSTICCGSTEISWNYSTSDHLTFARACPLQSPIRNP